MVHMLRSICPWESPYDWGFSWSDDYMYCSELVWKAYDAAELSGLPIQTIGYYLGQLPAEKANGILSRLNQYEVCQVYRHGKKVDPTEQAVSPEDIYQSVKLVSITDDSP